MTTRRFSRFVRATQIFWHIWSFVLAAVASLVFVAPRSCILCGGGSIFDDLTVAIYGGLLSCTLFVIGACMTVCSAACVVKESEITSSLQAMLVSIGLIKMIDEKRSVRKSGILVAICLAAFLCLASGLILVLSKLFLRL